MGSRAILNQNTEDMAPGEVNHKKNVAGICVGEGRNKQALGDIGNVVPVRVDEGKPIRRSITSFCAQLLANAQAAAKDQQKKPVHVNMDGIPKPRQKKVVIKPPKQQDIIVIISPKSPTTASQYSSSSTLAAFTSL